MSCTACNCEYCEEDRDHDEAMNRSNDMDDDDDDDEELMPEPPRWDNVAAGNDAQVKGWLGFVNETLDHYKVQGMPLVTLLSVVAQKIPGLRPENYSTVMAQVEKTLRESPDFEFRKGPRGGLFRKSNPLAPIHGTLPAPMPTVVAITVADNCTCKACGNTKLNNMEKSCWKCGNSLH